MSDPIAIMAFEARALATEALGSKAAFAFRQIREEARLGVFAADVILIEAGPDDTNAGHERNRMEASEVIGVLTDAGYMVKRLTTTTAEVSW